MLGSMSQRRRVYHVFLDSGVVGPKTCCTVECNRAGDLEIRVITSSPSPAMLDQFGSPKIAADVAQAFEKLELGVLYLVHRQLGARLPPGLSFLREFGKAMMTHWILAERATGASPGGPPEGLLHVWWQVARETPGLERLSHDVLPAIWKKVCERVVQEITAAKVSLAEWMEQFDPAWRKLGTIVMQLDDLMEDAARPFSLVTSYVDAIAARSNLVTTPISVPIFGECRVPGLRKHLYELLRRAGQSCGVVRRLFESQEIFSPCNIIPRDAYAFVRDVPALQALGIEVRLPRWWKELRRPEIRVRVRVGTGAPRPVGGMFRLDLDAAIIVGEHELTEAQWRTFIREEHDGLVYLGDRWVEILRDRIQAAVEASRRVEELRARGGVTYAEAIEFTDVPLPGDEPRTRPAPTSATNFEPGAWLKAALSAIERWDVRRDAEPGHLLVGRLYGHQRQGIAWLSTLMDAGVGALLADDMGLGKTLQVIGLIAVLHARGDEGPHLIVARASLLANWKAEFERFAPKLTVGVVHGDQDIDGNAPSVVLTTYQTLERREALLERSWGLVVLDEAQDIRNPGTRAATTVKRLRTRMRVCLTGTPIYNHIGDLWSLMDFLNPGMLGTETEFRQWLSQFPTDQERVAQVRRRVRPFILRRLKTDPLIAGSLPEKIETTIFCGMTPLQSTLYGQTVDTMCRSLKGEGPAERRVTPFELIIRLKQICNHPALGFDNNFDPYTSGKFISLADLARSIDRAGDHLLVFTQYQKMAEPIAIHLQRIMSRPAAVLDGPMSTKKRDQVVAEFQSGQGPGALVLTYEVGGVGLNLTTASNVILFDRPWNRAVEEQAIDRAFRIGQTKNVFVYKFLCRGTFEDRIDKLIKSKAAMVGDFFTSDDPELAFSKLSPEQLLTHLSLDPERVDEVTPS